MEMQVEMAMLASSPICENAAITVLHKTRLSLTRSTKLYSWTIISGVAVIRECRYNNIVRRICVLLVGQFVTTSIGVCVRT